ncbi:zinc-ribbon domain-containing protein [Streptomyces sp. NPDC046900]|uniref:zinc-ribbon domain-containing protein n=1 Tax=Streptomyces sp. NPDC046900 TaxID=3155473 RepID=UPI003407802A
MPGQERLGRGARRAAVAGSSRGSLAEAFPEVAATWLQERNGGLTPEKATARMRVEVWWRCPAGHEWQETIAKRASLLKWKNGDIAACPQCVGFRVPYTYPECGHTRKITAEAAAKKHGRCWGCYSRWWQENEQRLKAELSAAAKAAAPRAGELLDAVALPEAIPGPLVSEWRWWATKRLQGAIAAEEMMGKEGETSRILSAVTERAGQLIPTRAEAERAASAGGDGVLRLLDQAHWAEGWLHVLTGRRARPVAERDLRDVGRLLATVFEDWAEDAAEQVGEMRAAGSGPPSTAQITKSLTEAMLEFAHAAMEPSCRVYRELRLPVVPDGKSRYGRADVVIWSPPLPDFFVEIDSAHNPASAQKLAFARDAGAFPVWVRFGSGSIEMIDGVVILDLRETVRGVREAQAAHGDSARSDGPA